ncbi:hypothetical protein SLEP1_g24637 [Rubroshorea leprosula]|uniref:Uncharacterized protein n=1 Tax=Rubroshorea leprosula TaxID=152421 RepID=A0AAV5JSE3_9ROSI|nr:hypothetical protein SLEP1_g24637 [Rubroshorea leprosula]
MIFLLTSACFISDVVMLLVTLLVGEVINASTCRHVSDRAGSFSGLASGDYTLVNRVPASGRFINAGHNL